MYILYLFPVLAEDESIIPHVALHLQLFTDNKFCFVFITRRNIVVLSLAKTENAGQCSLEAFQM